MRIPSLFQVLASAALLSLIGAGLPADAQAGQLVSGVTAKVGGVSADVGAKVNVGSGKLSTDVDANLGNRTTVKARIGDTTSSFTAKARIARIIDARARLLGPKRLLELCASVGAKSCNGKSRGTQMKLIEARLRLLSGKELARVCVAVGGSCGGTTLSASPAPPRGDVEPPSRPGNLSLASTRGEGAREMRLTCRSILGQPAKYEVGLVKLCRQMLQ
ncbi:hypothetical protein [Aestuariivirga sp.]|uniref:hypothetical protein n=1 Tax=Aestuariivirga sp. TaxID=2650926 RepID=UPI00391CF3CD